MNEKRLRNRWKRSIKLTANCLSIAPTRTTPQKRLDSWSLFLLLFLLGNGATCCSVAWLTIFPSCSVSGPVVSLSFFFFTSSRWSRAGNIQTVEKKSECAANMLFLPTFGLRCYRCCCSGLELKITKPNDTNHHLQTMMWLTFCKDAGHYVSRCMIALCVTRHPPAATLVQSCAWCSNTCVSRWVYPLAYL